MRLPGLSPTDLDSEQQALYEAIAGGRRASLPGSPQSPAGTDGVLRGPFNAMLFSPPIGDGQQRLGAAIRFHSTLPDRARELAILAVAAHHRSAFERRAHEAIGRAAGLTDDEMQAVADQAALVLDDEVEATVLAAARRLLTTGDLDDDEYAEVVGAIGERALVELSALVGYYALLALQMRLFRIDPPPDA